MPTLVALLSRDGSGARSKIGKLGVVRRQSSTARNRGGSGTESREKKFKSDRFIVLSIRDY